MYNKRKKINNKKSKRSFTRNASTHKKNFRSKPLRGGIRL